MTKEASVSVPEALVTAKELATVAGERMKAEGAVAPNRYNSSQTIHIVFHSQSFTQIIFSLAKNSN